MIPSRSLKTGIRLLARQARAGAGRTIAFSARPTQASLLDARQTFPARQWYSSGSAQSAEPDPALEAATDAEVAANAAQKLEEAEAEAAVGAALEEAQGAAVEAQVGGAEVEAEAVALDVGLEETPNPEADAEAVAAEAARETAETIALNSNSDAFAEATSAGTVAFQTAPDASHKNPHPRSNHQIFLANLPWVTTQPVLLEWLERFGPVQDLMLNRRRDGRLTGYGFVTFEDHTKNRETVTALSGADFLGRSLIAELADPARAGPTRSWKGRPNGNNLYTTGLPSGPWDVVNTDSVKEAIKDAVEQQIGVRPNDVRLHRLRDSPQEAKGTGHLVFEDDASATTALEAFEGGAQLNYDGQSLTIKESFQRRTPTQRYGQAYSAGVPAGGDQGYNQGGYRQAGQGYGGDYGESYGADSDRVPGRQRGGFRGRGRRGGFQQSSTEPEAY